MQRLIFDETKQLANELGISYSPNIGKDKLAERIQEHAENENLDLSIRIDEMIAQRAVDNTDQAPTDGTGIIRDFGDYVSKHEVKTTNLKMSQKQVRCIISCNNPNKASQTSEIFSVLNEFMPDETKPVPFGTPTHVSQALLGVIKAKRFTSYAPDKNKNPIIKDLPEYTVELLPPLTDEELSQIKASQQARNKTPDMD